MRKKLAFLVPLIIVGTFIFLYTPQTNRENQPCIVNPNARGTIIILNGVSSVGKTSIQKELQQILDEPYLALGIDSLLVGSLPDRCVTGDYLQKDRPKGGVEGMHGMYERDDQGKILKLEFGPACRNLVRGMHRTFAAMADQRNNIVVDYTLYDQKWLPDLVDALYGYRVYFVGIKAPLNVVQMREKKRGTSSQGLARAYYDTVHKHGQYDVIVDVSELSAKEAAQKIKNFVAKNPQPKAFKQLYKELIK